MSYTDISASMDSAMSVGWLLLLAGAAVVKPMGVLSPVSLEWLHYRVYSDAAASVQLYHCKL